MIHAMLWFLLTTGAPVGDPTPGKVTPKIQTLCKKLQVKRLNELFTMEVKLHQSSLPKLQQSQIPSLSLKITCDTLSFMVHITHAQSGMKASRRFIFPQAAVDLERVVALAATQMLWADLKNHAKLIILRKKRIALHKKQPPKEPKPLPAPVPKPLSPSNWQVSLFAGGITHFSSAGPTLWQAGGEVSRHLRSGLKIGADLVARRGSANFTTGDVLVSMASARGVLGYDHKLSRVLRLSGSLSAGVAMVSMQGKPAAGLTGSSLLATTLDMEARLSLIIGFSWGGISLYGSGGIFLPDVTARVPESQMVRVGGAWAGGGISLFFIIP